MRERQDGKKPPVVFVEGLQVLLLSVGFDDLTVCAWQPMECPDKDFCLDFMWEAEIRRHMRATYMNPFSSRCGCSR